MSLSEGAKSPYTMVANKANRNSPDPDKAPEDLGDHTENTIWLLRKQNCMIFLLSRV